MENRNRFFCYLFFASLILISLFGNMFLKIQNLKEDIDSLKISFHNLSIKYDELYQRSQSLKDDIRHLKQKIEMSKLRENEKINSISHFKNRYYVKLLEIEGSYSNDRHDTGSETVYGITRRYDNNHQLWTKVDRIKEFLENNSIYNIDTLKDHIEKSDRIQQLVYNTYERKWKRYKLNEFPFELSSQFFDIIINCGEVPAIKMLQYVLNAFNYKHQFGQDLIIDGYFGDRTIQFLNKVINSGYTSQIIDSLVSLRINHYLNISNINKNQRKFINGWIKRANNIY